MLNICKCFLPKENSRYCGNVPEIEVWHALSVAVASLVVETVYELKGTKSVVV